MTSSSASGSKLAELEEDLKGLQERKAAILDSREIAPRDQILLSELNKDMVESRPRSQPCSLVSFTILSRLLPHTPLCIWKFSAYEMSQGCNASSCSRKSTFWKADTWLIYLRTTLHNALYCQLCVWLGSYQPLCRPLLLQCGNSAPTTFSLTYDLLLTPDCGLDWHSLLFYVFP